MQSAENSDAASDRPSELLGELGFDVDDPLSALMARCREVILGFALFLEMLMGPAPNRPRQTRLAAPQSTPHEKEAAANPERRIAELEQTIAELRRVISALRRKGRKMLQHVAELQ